MLEKDGVNTGPRKPMSFGAKLIIGGIACALLWTIFGPSSHEPAVDRVATASKSDGEPHSKLEISDATSCAQVVSAFDDRNQKSILAINAYIDQAMRRSEARHVLNGEPAIIPKFSREGYLNVRTTAVVECRNHPSKTLRSATIDMYEGARQMQKELGVLGD